MSLPGVRMITERGSPSSKSCSGSSVAISSPAADQAPASYRSMRTGRDESRVTSSDGRRRLPERRDEGLVIGRRIEIVKLARIDARGRQLGLIEVGDVERIEHARRSMSAAVEEARDLRCRDAGVGGAERLSELGARDGSVVSSTPLEQEVGEPGRR